MKKIIVAVLIIMAMAGTSREAAAQKKYLPSNYKAPQQQQIPHGVVLHKKHLRSEAHSLRFQQARIAQMKRMAMADGYLSPKERMMIIKAERNINRKNAYPQKHDRQSRF